MLIRNKMAAQFHCKNCEFKIFNGQNNNSNVVFLLSFPSFRFRNSHFNNINIYSTNSNTFRSLNTAAILNYFSCVSEHIDYFINLPFLRYIQTLLEDSPRKKPTTFLFWVGAFIISLYFFSLCAPKSALNSESAGQPDTSAFVQRQISYLNSGSSDVESPPLSLLDIPNESFHSSFHWVCDFPDSYIKCIRAAFTKAFPADTK
jgi:hypothetical protein